MKSIVASYLPQMIDIRRYLHMHPEISFVAHETHKFILKQLEQYEDLVIQAPIGDTLSIIATIGDAHPHIAFRADFDALPIPDEKDVPYRSKNPGISHACGHDAHTATLLTLLDVVYKNRAQLNGAVSFIFQDSEELLPGSAKRIVESGVLNPVDKVYGQHYWSQIDLDTVEVCKNEIIASPDVFNITITGSGGHAAYPHTTIDPIVIASEVIISLQSIVSRQLSPLDKAVVSFGMVDGGKAFNVIPGKVMLKGTCRTFDGEVSKKIKEIMTRECEFIAEKRGAHAEVEYVHGFPALINHADEADIVRQSIQDADLNYVEATPLMIGEDFSYYLQEKPGAFFLTGSSSDDATSVPHHAATFDLDERAMLNGLSVFMKILENEGVIVWSKEKLNS